MSSCLNKDSSTNSINDDDLHDENNWKEISIAVPWGTVQGKWWGDQNKQPILALHGWQENCGAFDRLCVLMPQKLSILCIDLPGHGKSSHYPKGMQYYLFWDGICLIRRIIREYKWKNVTLMGHSLGGALCFMYAACYPDEVDKLINIDIAGPSLRNMDDIAANTGHNIDKYLDYENVTNIKSRCAPYDDMIQIALKAYDGSIDEDSVKILMQRGMTLASSSSTGLTTNYYFSRDLRLKVSILGLLSRDQILAYARRVRCKYLNIRAQPGLTFEVPQMYDEVIEELQKCAKLVIYKKVFGSHHVHLVNPERIAPHINDFLLKS